MYTHALVPGREFVFKGGKGEREREGGGGGIKLTTWQDGRGYRMHRV